MRILFVGDIFGRPGRRAVEKFVPALRKEYGIDFCIANAENSASGKGLTQEIAHQLHSWGIDVLTGGNHTFHNRDVLALLESDNRVLRPINYPEGVPGQGWGIYKPESKNINIGVISSMGRVFLRELDNPFHVVQKKAEELSGSCRIILVDFHAEATSEKIAMGWHLDGLVSAVIGTHTHIPTADERILPNGTAYITDSGMTGPYDSVIGVRKDVILNMFLTQMPVKHEVATGHVQLHSVLIEVDELTGKATHIERIRRDLGD